MGHLRDPGDLVRLVHPLRLLVDLLLRAQDLHREAGTGELQVLVPPAGPMLVHCSAGVGRTGTFMALYKLWLDYQATSCTSLAIMPTVLALREQRCLMVQKEVQYHYIARCLRLVTRPGISYPQFHGEL